jgi:hypothetical protein
MRRRQLAGPSSPFDRGLRLGEQEGGACFLAMDGASPGELFPSTLSRGMYIQLLTNLVHSPSRQRVAEAAESPVPENNADVLFKDIYVPDPEPRWMRSRTAEETTYYYSVVVRGPDGWSIACGTQ